MAVYIEQGWDPEDDDNAPPLTHARILWQPMDASISVSGTAAGSFAGALQNPFTYETWQADSLPAYIDWATGEDSPEPVNAIYIHGHSMGDLFRAGEPVTVGVELDGIQVMEFIPEDNSTIMCLFALTLAEEVTLTFAGTVAPTIAVVKAGKTLDMQRPIYGGHAPAPLNRRVKISEERSWAGQALGFRVRNEGFDATYEWQNLKADWYRTHFDPFADYALEGGYFAIAWRPGKFGEVVYGAVSGSINPSNTGTRDYMSVSLSVDGLGPKR